MEGTEEARTYSMASWVVKPGREAEFISAWQDFAQWTADMKIGAIEGTLVQDTEDPRRFICFWPFQSEDGVKKWRSDPKFREFMMRMRAYCESFQPSINRKVGYINAPIQLGEATAR